MGVIKGQSNAECKNWKLRKFVKFLATYFPTLDDATWNYVIPILSVALSCFSFGIFYALVGNELNRYDCRYSELNNFGYLILAGAAGISLHYGLMDKNKRDFGFWIVLKITDLILAIGANIWYIRIQYRPIYPLYIIATILSLMNLSMLYYVIQLSKNLPDTECEITYETPNVKRPIAEA